VSISFYTASFSLSSLGVGRLLLLGNTSLFDLKLVIDLQKVQKKASFPVS
jgi:hypothetical protein